MKIQYSGKREPGRYAAYTNFEASPTLIFQTVLIWTGTEWLHNSTGDMCKLVVHGWIGPLPVWVPEELEWDL